jgi:hypothetical protein
MATTNPTINSGGVERPMTDQELAAYEQTVAQAERQNVAQEAAVAAKASAVAKLAALGLTEDEVNALIGGI